MNGFNASKEAVIAASATCVAKQGIAIIFAIEIGR
jgi:hypothetical protein